MLSGLGEHIGLDPELIDDIKTAVSEACNNVVLHAYPGGPGLLVVELKISVDGLEIVVADRGLRDPAASSPATTGWASAWP